MILIHDISDKKPTVIRIIYRLNYILRSFLTINPDYIKQINKILLINFSELFINSSDIKKYFSEHNLKILEEKGNEVLNNIIFNLLSNAVILNTPELFPSNETKLKSERNNIYYIQNLNTDVIKRIIDDNKIIFLAERIKPIFAHILLSLGELVGFYSGLKFGGRWCKEITDTKRFLEIIIHLNRPAKKVFDYYPEDNLPRSYLDIFRNWELHKTENKKRLLKSDFYDAFKMYSGHKNSKLFLYGGDKYISDKFIMEYQKKRGSFASYNCKDGNFFIEKNHYGNIFDNIDTLLENTRSELINELKSETYTNRTIILRSDFNIEDNSLLKFAKIRVPTLEKIFPKIPLLFFMILKEKSVIRKKRIPGTKSIWLWYLKSCAVKPLYKSLNSIYELDLLIENVLDESEINIDPRWPDFWYELLDDQKLKAVRRQLEEKNLKFTQIERDNQYVFRRLPNKHFAITFNYSQIYPEKPNSDGMFYIYTIIKQAAFEPITVKTLYQLKLGVDPKMSEGEILNSDDADNFSLGDNFEPSSKIEKDKILAGLEEEKKHYEENIKAAELYGDKKLLNEFKDELTKAEKEIERVKYGKKKNLDKNAKKAIDKALKEAKDQFKESHPEFYDFLVKNIIYNRYNYSYSYKNIDNIFWILE